MIDTIQDKKEISRKLKERAIFEGFTVAGIASIPGSSRVKLRTNALERWLSNNYHAEMKWMEAEKRKNISSLFEDAKSVLGVGFSYNNSQNNKNNFLKVAKFSQGEDYHKVIHTKLVEEEGHDPIMDPEAYYKEIDRNMALEFPHKFAKKETETTTKPTQTVASATRSSKTGRVKTQRLTPSEVAIAKKLGVPLDKFAEEKQKLLTKEA